MCKTYSNDKNDKKVIHFKGSSKKAMEVVEQRLFKLNRILRSFFSKNNH